MPSTSLCFGQRPRLAQPAHQTTTPRQFWTTRVTHHNGTHRRSWPGWGSISGRSHRPVADPLHSSTLPGMEVWEQSAPGVLCLPSGRLVRGRGLRQPLPAGTLPQFALYLQGTPPPAVAWPSRWLRWPDWRLPTDPGEARQALADLWQRAAIERVEVACSGGRGRTGTALACLAILDGVPAADAVGYVRQHYDPRAVETPWQRRFVARFQR